MMSNQEAESPLQKRFGDYEILKPIGKGKFAVVYRAKRVDSEEIVALKRINVDSIDDKARDKCLKEVRLLQSLDHPNVIRYLDSFITDNDLVIVFEWAAAGDLKRQLRKAQERGVGFEERVIWKYFSQICDAIHHMHDRRIMHRDLKPANIFLTLDGTVKVGDLGLSRELSEHTIQAHSKVGTPLYMSPEVLRGDGYDFKSDVWSLGCLLYELAMLKSPFKSEGLNLYLLFQKISQGDYQPLPENYSEELRKLAYSMISTKPEDRPEITTVCIQARKMRALFNDKNASMKRQQAAQQQSKETEESMGGSGTGPNESNGDSAKSRSHDAAEAKKGSDQDEFKAAPFSDVNPSFTSDISGRATPPMSRRGDASSLASKPSGKNEDNFPSTSAQERISTQSQQGSQQTSNSNIRREDASRKESVEDALRKSKPQSHSELDDKPYAGGWNERSYADQYHESKPSKSKQKAAPVVTHRAKVSPEKSKSSVSASPPRDFLGAEDEGVEKPGTLSNNSVAFALMEAVYDRLVVLGYPMEEGSANKGQQAGGRVQRAQKGRGRLLPMHFACDLNLLGRVAGYEQNAQFLQFRRMVDVAAWLVKKIGGPGAEMIARMEVERDPPLMIAKQLLGAAQAAGIPQEALSDILPTALSAGHGEKVCTYLFALSEKAWQSVQTDLSMKYEADGMDAGTVINEGKVDDDDDEIDDDAAVDNLEDDAPMHDLSVNADDMSSSHIQAQSVLVAAVDPVLWREETERVAKQLTTCGDRMLASGSGWSEHLLTMKRIVGDCYRSADQLDDNAKSPKSGTKGQYLFICQTLHALDSEIKSDLTNVQRAESLVNSRMGVAALGSQYSGDKKDLVELEARASKANQKIAEGTESMAVIEEQLSVIQEKLEAKSSGEGGSGSAMALREAIKKLKEEIVQMSLTTGLLNANLLQKRVAASNSTRKIRTESSKRRRAEGKKADTATDELWNNYD